MTASSRRRSGGTLFLDEVGELPPPAQVKLLRAMQEGEVEPVGGKRPVQVNVRVISATNRDLLADVKSGRFREDLFYRLHVFPILGPAAARARRGHPRTHPPFHGAVRGRGGQAGAVDVGRRAAPARRPITWPGNVRQLENAIFRAVVLAEGEEIGLDEFPHIASPGGADEACRAIAAPVAPATFTDLAPVLAPPSCSMTTADRSRRRPAEKDLAAGRTCSISIDEAGPRAAARGDRGGGDPVRPVALSQPDVGGRAAAADRPLHALPQARRTRASRSPTRRVPELTLGDSPTKS